jgi:crooked neck
MSYAQFEMSAADEGNVFFARQVYERANQALRCADEKEERVLLLEAWRDFETQHGDNESLEKVMQKIPRRVKKRQRVLAEDGVSYLFFWYRAVLSYWWWLKVIWWYRYLGMYLFFFIP